MQKGILAGRLQTARERITIAAESAVREYAVGPLLLDELIAAQREKQPDVRALYELEALGPIVEALTQCLGDALAQQTHAVTQAEILAIPGLTATSKKAIEAYFASLENDAGSD